MVIGQLHAPAALPPGNNLDTHWIGIRVDHTAGLGDLERGKSLVPAGIRAPDGPARSLVAVPNTAYGS